MADDIAKLSWLPDRRADSLQAVYVHAIERVRQSARWYENRHGSKRRWARWLRVGAILLTSTAALLPLLSQLFTHDGKPVIQPVWASIALILAVALIALDRYFGFSSGWMRFIIAELHLHEIADDFEFAWHAQRATWENGTPSDEQVQRALTSLRELLATSARIVRDETASWVTEFETELKQLDETIQNRSSKH